MLCFITFNVFLLLIFQCSSFDMPDNFPRCNLNDPEHDNCILNATEALRPEIRKGIDKVKLPAFNPLLASYVGALQETPLVNYTADFNNCSFVGLDEYKFKEIHYNPKTMAFTGTIKFDFVNITCIYNIKAKLLHFPVEGNGTIHIDLGGINAAFELNGKMKTRKAVDYYNPISTKIRGTIGKAHYQYGNLFNGNEELGRRTNELINENSKIITEEVTPAVEVLAEKGLMYMMKRFMRTIPYNVLFKT